MQSIRWETCGRNFEPDGVLRDIYVRETSSEDWRSVFAMLGREYELEFYVDGVARPVPTGVEEVFTIRKIANPLLRFAVRNVVVCCHFFDFEEIEFDIDPRDVRSQEALDSLLGFMRRVGDTVAKPVILTYENDREHPFISYDPGQRAFSEHGQLA